MSGFIAAAALFFGLWTSQQAAEAATWEAKVDPWVLETAAANDETEFLVYLNEQADLSGADSLTTKEEKGAYVYEQLTAVAQRTQPALIAQLEDLGVSYRRYWITNMIWVRGNSSAMETLARREDVAHLYANPTVSMPTLPVADDAALFGPEAIEWNITKVNADDVWAMGYTGQNVVVAGQDTGYLWSHTGLQTQYRGWNGVTADHDYNWHDSIHSGGGSCGADSTFPCDDQGHGTHTMGTIVGNDMDPNNPGWPASATNAVGMAPGAEWISCRNMNVGDGTPATYSECYEWFIAPYPIGGDPMTDGDPTKAPHVINNSWGCPVSEGCTDPNVLLSVVQAVRSAGIVTVHSAGNEGSSCSSVQTPAAIYDESFSVAAVNSSDSIASFSSRGPVTVDGSNRMKPDISAPGVNIRSTTRDGSYQGGWSGTSMAGPHVAGLVALIISANPSLAGNVDAIEQIIAETAVPLTTSQGCGGDTSTDVPNNVFGWGRIDALAAVELALQEQPVAMSVSKTASAASVMPGDMLTYTLTVTNLSTISSTTSVVISDTLPEYTDYQKSALFTKC
ncbi:MAG: S8 family serine peptidase [Chloroflexota bacterium]